MATRWVPIPLVSREDGLWFGRLDDAEIPTGAQLWLGVQTSRRGAEIDVPEMLKTASWSEIAGLVGSNDAGVAAEFSPIPAGGPPNEVATWFRLRAKGAWWEALSSEGSIAMFLSAPYAPDVATLVLYADADTIVGPTTRPAKDWGPPLA